MNIPLRLSIPLLIFVLSLFPGCRKPSTTAPVTPATSSTSPDSSPHPEGGTSTASQVKYFKGSIGSSLDLQMKLTRTGDQLTGTYFYQKIGKRIDLRGAIDNDGNVSLDEFDPNGKQTGVFKGIWKADREDGLVTIAGNWSKPPNEKGGDKKTAFSIHEEPIALSGDAELASKQIKESNKKLKYEIDAQYPQLSGGSNPNFEKFNQVVRASVTEKIGGFKKDMGEPDQAGTVSEESMGSDISIGYTVALLQDDLASIEFSVSSYYSGAAHPNSFSYTINYDLKNGKQLKLPDIFKPGAKYLPALSAYSISDLKKQSKANGPDGMLDDSSIESGAGPSAKNFESWTIKKKGLGINFDPYQVGPYAAGPQFVLVPYASLKDLINPEGPVGSFVK